MVVFSSLPFYPSSPFPSSASPSHSLPLLICKILSPFGHPNMTVKVHSQSAYFHRVWVCRIIEWSGLGGNSGGHLVQPPSSSMAPLGKLPRMEATHPLGAHCPHAQSLLQYKSVSWCLEVTFQVSICAHCLRSCHWSLLERTWLHLLCRTSLSSVC